MGFFIPNSLQIQTNSQSLLIHPYPSLACYLFNKLFNSIACLLYFINLQLVIPGRTWILLYLGRTVYKRLWACLALYSCEDRLLHDHCMSLENSTHLFVIF